MKAAKKIPNIFLTFSRNAIKNTIKRLPVSVAHKDKQMIPVLTPPVHNTNISRFEAVITPPSPNTYYTGKFNIEDFDNNFKTSITAWGKTLSNTAKALSMIRFAKQPPLPKTLYSTISDIVLEKNFHTPDEMMKRIVSASDGILVPASDNKFTQEQENIDPLDVLSDVNFLDSNFGKLANDLNPESNSSAFIMNEIRAEILKCARKNIIKSQKNSTKKNVTPPSQKKTNRPITKLSSSDIATMPLIDLKQFKFIDEIQKGRHEVWQVKDSDGKEYYCKFISKSFHDIARHLAERGEFNPNPDDHPTNNDCFLARKEACIIDFIASLGESHSPPRGFTAYEQEKFKGRGRTRYAILSESTRAETDAEDVVKTFPEKERDDILSINSKNITTIKFKNKDNTITYDPILGRINANLILGAILGEDDDNLANLMLRKEKKKNAETGPDIPIGETMWRFVLIDFDPRHNLLFSKNGAQSKNSNNLALEILCPKMIIHQTLNKINNKDISRYERLLTKLIKRYTKVFNSGKIEKLIYKHFPSPLENNKQREDIRNFSKNLQALCLAFSKASFLIDKMGNKALHINGKENSAEQENAQRALELLEKEYDPNIPPNLSEVITERANGEIEKDQNPHTV